MNSYFICCFACCRELFDPDKMKDCVKQNIAQSEVMRDTGLSALMVSQSSDSKVSEVFRPTVFLEEESKEHRINQNEE